MSKTTAPTRLAACLLSLCLSAPGALARDYAVGPLKIVHPWSRPTPPGARTAAGYLTIDNTGSAADRLIGVDSPAADKVEIHQESMTGGIMRMRAVSDGVLAPAHGAVKLAPGGYHLMFIGPKHPFRAGERIPVTLRFARAGAASVELTVETPAADGAPMGAMNMPGMR
jgi:copper(I)-binding protein